MSRPWPRAASIAALLIVTISISSGCSSGRVLQQAASEQGRAAARVVLPPLPGECRNAVPHASVALGSNPVVVLARERGQLDIANNTISRCAGFYADVKTRIEGN